MGAPQFLRHDIGYPAHPKKKTCPVLGDWTDRSRLGRSVQDTTIHLPCRTFHHLPMPQNLPSESKWGLHVPEHHGFGLLFPRAVTHGFSPIGQGGTRGFLGTEHGAGHGATSVGSRMRVVPHLFGRISGRWYEWHLVLTSWGKNGLIWCGQLEWYLSFVVMFGCYNH